MFVQSQKQNAKLIGLLVGSVLLVLSSLAHAEELDETPASNSGSNLGVIIKVDAGYQYADVKGLRGPAGSILFGLPFHRSQNVRAYLEAGLNEVTTERAGLPSTRVVIGSRIAWMWDKISLHVDGHLGYGDRSITASNTLIDGGLVDLGMGVYYDLFEYENGSKASLGLVVSGTLHRTANPNEDSFKADLVTGRGGLSLVIW